MKTFLQSLNVDETLTKIRRKDNTFNSIKSNIPLISGYNYMMDILHLPYDKQVKTKYLLVLVDLADDSFDIEPVERKDPKTTVQAINEMFQRKYIKVPYASIRTDGGTEFKGEFNAWCSKHGIVHKVGLSNRHIQVANVERLNRELGRVFNGYMRAKSKELDRPYYGWSDILEKTRKALNEIRKKKLPALDKVTYPYFSADYKTNKFKVGDLVYRALDEPRNEYDQKLHGGFRMGDFRFEKYPRRITQLLYYPAKFKPGTYRYMLSGIDGASFPEADLIEAKGEIRERKQIKGIADKKEQDGKIMYKVWYKNETKSDADWQPEEEVKEDGGKELIKIFNEKNNPEAETKPKKLVYRAVTKNDVHPSQKKYFDKIGKKIIDLEENEHFIIRGIVKNKSILFYKYENLETKADEYTPIVEMYSKPDVFRWV